MSLLAAIPLLAGATAEPSAPTDDHHHAHAQGSPAEAAPETAGRHSPDDALRAGMRSIHTKLDADSDAATLARGIRDDIQGMFRQCTLPPDADATLHGILARILDDTTRLESADAAVRDQARTGMRTALADYACRFDDAAFATCNR